MSAKENRIELTKAVIDAAVCEQGKPFVYIMDTAVGGFGVRVTPAGNKQYVIRFQFNGKRISKTFAPVDKLSVTAARARAKFLMSEYILGRDPLKQAEEAKKLGPTIYELYEAWEKWAKEQGKIRETVKTMLCCLRQSINVDTKRTRSLTHTDLENFKHARLKAGLKPSTINRTIRELRYLYKWGVETGNLPDDCTFPDVKALSESQLSPKIHYLSDVDVKKLLDTVDEMTRQRPEKSYLRDIILFALNTGIRPASICGLERRDVLRLDEDGGEIRLRAANIKTRKDANLPISAAASEILGKRMMLCTDASPTGRVFTTYTPRYICKSIKKVMLEAGLNPEFSAYSLRHNYATSLYRQGASPVEIQLQMCHSSFKSTQKYIHSDYEHQKEVANKLRFTNRDRDEAKTA